MPCSSTLKTLGGGGLSVHQCNENWNTRAAPEDHRLWKHKISVSRQAQHHRWLRFPNRGTWHFRYMRESANEWITENCSDHVIVAKQTNNCKPIPWYHHYQTDKTALSHANPHRWIQKSHKSCSAKFPTEQILLIRKLMVKMVNYRAPEVSLKVLLA